MGLLVFLVVALAVGAVCGFVALARTRQLLERIQRLENRITDFEAVTGDGPELAESLRTSPAQAPSVSARAAPARDGGGTPPTAAATTSRRDSDEPSRSAVIAASFRGNWMIWLGGSCLCLGGVYLVRYSVDAGLLGPFARVVLAILGGIGCHFAAEYLRRKSGDSHAALGALAGAGSISVYAAIFAATRLYDMLDPRVSFLVLATVALGTMMMARLHGPLLAAFGILGAYLVPILISSGPGDMRMALVYALVVSSSALLLLRYVYRGWLWWGFVVGALSWWLLSLGSLESQAWRTPYLTVLSYLTVALPSFDWSLRRRNSVPRGSYDPRVLVRLPERSDTKLLAFHLLVLVAVLVNVLVLNTASAVGFAVAPYLVLSLVLSRHQEQLYWHSWLLVLGASAALLAASLSESSGTWTLQPLADAEIALFAMGQLLQVLIVTALALRNLLHAPRPAVWASLAAFSPLIALLTAYMLVHRPDTEANWGMVTAMVSLLYLLLAGALVKRQSVASLALWLVVVAHFGLSVAAAIVLPAASLTLAIAMQLLSIAWIIRRFEIDGLAWLFKLVVAIVVTRLSLNPWLLGYPEAVHWSLWTYGGSTVLAFTSSWILRSHASLARWSIAAALHLLVLTIWSELRYQLYDGRVYAPEFTYLEATIFLLLTAALALVYYQRSLLSRSIRRFLQLYATVLALAAVSVYVFILIQVLSNSAWISAHLSSTPILNLATVSFGAPVLFALLFARFFDPRFRRSAMIFCGIALFVFLSSQIRHLWAGTLALAEPAVVAGELYTYSAVWLLMAVAGLLTGARFAAVDVYRAGLIMLMLVIVKLFLIDLSDLEGLLRVASLMGLGFSLLGISYLHRRFRGSSAMQAAR